MKNSDVPPEWLLDFEGMCLFALIMLGVVVVRNVLLDSSVQSSVEGLEPNVEEVPTNINSLVLFKMLTSELKSVL